jgi:hypothetical protein
MPINRDDIISEINVSGSSGITCNRAEIAIDPITRNLRVNFNLVKITVLADGRYFEEQQMPISVDLADGTGTKTFPIYNRRTGLPAAGGQTRQYDILTRDLMSLFFATAAASGVA